MLKGVAWPSVCTWHADAHMGATFPLLADNHQNTEGRKFKLKLECPSLCKCNLQDFPHWILPQHYACLLSSSTTTTIFSLTPPHPPLSCFLAHTLCRLSAIASVKFFFLWIPPYHSEGGHLCNPRTSLGTGSVTRLINKLYKMHGHLFVWKLNWLQKKLCICVMQCNVSWPLKTRMGGIKVLLQWLFFLVLIISRAC